MFLAEESVIHYTLKNKIKRSACRRGYCIEVKKKKKYQPDVLMSDSEGRLFLGDAKKAQNESPSDGNTASRIMGYISYYKGLVQKKKYKLGAIAIGTNLRNVTKEWKTWLNSVCRKAGFANPHFRIRVYRRADGSPDGYLVIWEIRNK